jgi:electron transport complex protein RnfC
MAQQGKGPFVSTVTGLVRGVGLFKGPDGVESTSVAIAPDARDLMDASLKPIEDFSQVPPADLRTAAGRAGFSTFISVSRDPSLWPTVETLVISTLDLDPWSVVNQQLFRERAGEADGAVRLMARAAEAKRCVLAVPGHLADSAGRFSQGTAQVVLVPPVYPNGLPEILARECGSGSLLTCKAGGVVGNTLVVGFEQAVAMADCLKEGKPLLEKTVTLCPGNGDPLKNYRLRIGTPVGDILEKEGTELQSGGKLVMNGILRGFACFSAEQPVTEAVDAVHVQAPSQVFFYEDSACTNCGKCNAVCPVNLEVNLLGRCSEYGVFEKCRDLGVENCVECGLCAYVCPARRPLVQFLAHAKQVIETETFEAVSMEEVMACDACGPTCPAIRLFDTTLQEQGGPEE